MWEGCMVDTSGPRLRWGGANSLVLISPLHKPCDLFRLWPGALAIFYHGLWLAGEGRFAATEVFHQHANTDVTVEWKMIYHSNNGNAYNQVTQIIFKL